MYEGESVNRSQMDIKHKHVIFERLFLDISSVNIDTLVLTSSSLAKHLPPSCEPLYTRNTSHRKYETFLYEYSLHWALSPTKKKHNRTLLVVSILLMHGRHFDYCNQPLNMRMRVCYLHCHETGLCCYLVIHIDNLLRPLQLFYFHLWPIYWLQRNYKYIQ
jgi:hypothetical protein